jgi:hypothetical protein
MVSLAEAGHEQGEPVLQPNGKDNTDDMPIASHGCGLPAGSSAKLPHDSTSCRSIVHDIEARVKDIVARAHDFKENSQKWKAEMDQANQAINDKLKKMGGHVSDNRTNPTGI